MHQWFEPRSFTHFIIGDAMSSLEEGVQQLDLYATRGEGRQDVDMRFLDQFVNLLRGRIRNQSGVLVEVPQLLQAFRGFFPGNHQRYFDPGKYTGQQPRGGFFIFRNGKISVV